LPGKKDNGKNTTKREHKKQYKSRKHFAFYLFTAYGFRSHHLQKYNIYPTAKQKSTSSQGCNEVENYIKCRSKQFYHLPGLTFR
jgi:hypothetical protein